jgi:hypothetical protein
MSTQARFLTQQLSQLPRLPLPQKMLQMRSSQRQHLSKFDNLELLNEIFMIDGGGEIGSGSENDDH